MYRDRLQRKPDSNSIDNEDSSIKITQERYDTSKKKLMTIEEKFDRDLGCLIIIQENSN